MPLGTCRLCLAESVDLVRSHITPKWSYKRLRDPNAESGNPNPVLISSRTRRAVQTSDQFAEHMLCRPCDQKFGDAENYLTRLVRQPDGATPLRDRLVVRDVTARRGMRVADAPGVDVGTIRRFAYSVLWRAHHCRELDRCNLGPYAEELRSHLHSGTALGDRFACIITYLAEPSIDPELAMVVTMPVSHRSDQGHMHWFAFLGFRFDFFVGKGTPRVIVDAVSSEEARDAILLASLDQYLLPQLGPMMRDAAPLPRRAAK